jgi:hypothetical protein
MLVYAASFDDNATTNDAMTSALLHQVFADNPTLSIQRFQNAGGRNQGAMQAMIEAVRQGWFQEYDWVLRLNPDVLAGPQ